MTKQDTLSQCNTATFTWTSTYAPYYLTIHNSATPSGFDSQDSMIIVPESNSASWVVDLTSGTEITVNVMDSAGEVAQTSP